MANILAGRVGVARVAACQPGQHKDASQRDCSVHCLLTLLCLMAVFNSTIQQNVLRGSDYYSA